MNHPDFIQQLEAVIPGVAAAYQSLKARDGMGLHTSSGSFYNHTLFGRDGSMTAKFVTDFDHETAVEAITALASLQGTQHDAVTQEEPGRIHHEFRDFRTWKGTLPERLLFLPWRPLWGVRDRQLLTYFSVDSTASYIRLVHKYATHIDAAILLKKVTNHHGETVVVTDSLVAAADWIMSVVRPDGLMMTQRGNRTSLPFQTFQDSPTTYSRADGSLANFRGPIGYVEVQAYAADALYDMAELLAGDEKAHIWRQTARQIHQALLTHYWSRLDEYLAPAIDSHGMLDGRNISAGWTLNTSLWHGLETAQRATYIEPIVRRLFSEEFLTPVGLRTMSLNDHRPMPGVIEYHGPEVVWPMFTFMVIEGLRRHRLFGLAEQLENRLINGLNLTGNFDEFFVVLRDGTLVLADMDGPDGSLRVQMPPEQRIAFTIVPAMVLAKRATYAEDRPAAGSWQRTLEREILATIPPVERLSPQAAAEQPVKRMKLRRWAGAYQTAKCLARELRRKS